MTVSAITTTANRPVGFRLAEFFMARQTRQPDEWIVADGGTGPVSCTQGQRLLHESAPAGPRNFLANLRRALTAVTGDIIVVIEDDDWYAPRHIETLLEQFDSYALIAGDDDQRYYNVQHRCWRRFENKGGCLCQTAFRRDLVPQLLRVIDACEQRGSYGVDTAFWASAPKAGWRLRRDHTVLGIKGLPGQVGLGIGHRPDAHWTADRAFVQLRSWIGQDVDLYSGLMEARS